MVTGRCSPCIGDPAGDDANGGSCDSCNAPCSRYLPCATAAGNSRDDCDAVVAIECVARCSSCIACYENDDTDCKDAAGNICDSCSDCSEYISCIDSPVYEGYKYIFDGAGKTFLDAQKYEIQPHRH